jgi:hypothetical protein
VLKPNISSEMAANHIALLRTSGMYCLPEFALLLLNYRWLATKVLSTIALEGLLLFGSRQWSESIR